MYLALGADDAGFSVHTPATGGVDDADCTAHAPATTVATSGTDAAF